MSDHDQEIPEEQDAGGSSIFDYLNPLNWFGRQRTVENAAAVDVQEDPMTDQPNAPAEATSPQVAPDPMPAPQADLTQQAAPAAVAAAVAAAVPATLAAAAPALPAAAAAGMAAAQSLEAAAAAAAAAADQPKPDDKPKGLKRRLTEVEGNLVTLRADLDAKGDSDPELSGRVEKAEANVIAARQEIANVNAQMSAVQETADKNAGQIAELFRLIND